MKIKSVFKSVFPSELRVLRLGLWLVLFFLFGFVLWQGIVPGGNIVYKHDLRDNDEFIGKLTPRERVKTTEDGRMMVIGEPVYFTLRTPRRFDSAKLKIVYENTGEVSLGEIGLLVDKTIWRHELKPMFNRTLDRLMMAWEYVAEDDILLLQRKKDFFGIENFLHEMPERNRIALYNYDVNSEYLIPGYASSTEKQSIEYPLRGPFEIYTYIKDEKLDFVFSIIDLNENKDSDPLDLHLYYDGELIRAEHLDDDGVDTDTGERSEKRILNMALDGLPEGAYKLELRANDDIVTEKIETSQAKLSFPNKLRLYRNNDNDITLFTDSVNLAAKTDDPGSLQTIRAGSSTLEIEKTYEQFEAIIKRASGTDMVHRLELEKDGVMLGGNGVFAFSAEALLNPNFKKVGPLLDINKEGIDYVLARYKNPVALGGKREVEIEFDLKKAYREDFKYSFLLSFPGLATRSGSPEGLIIDNIEIELKGKGVWEKIKEKLNNVQ